MEERGRYSVILLSIVSVIFLFLITIASSGFTPEEAIKITPYSITINDREVSEAWHLFDLDETTGYVPIAGHPLKLTFSGQHRIDHLRLYGSSNYILNVYQLTDKDPEKIPSLSGIDLRASGNSGTLLNLTNPLRLLHCFLNLYLFQVIPHL